jgi:hypothetical protein
MAKANPSVLHADTLLESNLIGQTYLRHHSIEKDTLTLVIHKTWDGRIFDIGVYQPLLHQMKQPGLQFAKSVFERLLFALYIKDQAYAVSIFGPGSIEITALSVGGKEASVKTLISESKGGFSYQLDTYEQASGFHKFGVKLQHHLFAAFTVGFRNSLSLTLVGQTNLYQNFLQKGLLNGSVRTEANEDLFDRYYTIEKDGALDCYTIQENDPYQDEFCFSNKGDTLIPYLPDLNELEKDLARRQAFYWMSLMLPQRSRIDLPNGSKPGDIKIRFLDYKTEEGETATMPLDTLIHRLRSVYMKGLPTYYGVMKTNTEVENQVELVSVCAIIDWDMQVEHVFRIKDRFATAGTQPVWKETDVDAFLGIRMDNVEDLNAKYKASSGYGDKKFKIDLKKGAN